VRLTGDGVRETAGSCLECCLPADGIAAALGDFGTSRWRLSEKLYRFAVCPKEETSAAKAAVPARLHPANRTKAPAGASAGMLGPGPTPSRKGAGSANDFNRDGRLPEL
jgi:hypothetical protein